ncbi:MAG TPA: hypothetical protein PLJ27_10510 [Polyangiaceae bacterium]|nr:MAG: hypothetical protein BWY17_02639 [Deltaproteobacteria bacterium ADurb.Bin207]HNS96711.1 hypothetical protein [Polyangiaceae bacterium]HNZ22420.1 hypothetical protein [Polyangiaceae bacterium]HOD20955.1 hypothetical protein [Polyangiaceae bacterium]HOE48314.1 hypothetical protein [Polyangiaceae bacterium]
MSVPRVMLEPGGQQETMRAFRFMVGTAAVAIFALGCGSTEDTHSNSGKGDAMTDGQVQVDGATDAGKDGPVEVSPDVQGDVIPETQPDTPMEAEPDTPGEAQPDSPEEAQPDSPAEVEPDVLIDSPVDVAQDTAPDTANDVNFDADTGDAAEFQLVEVDLDLRSNCIIEFSPSFVEVVAGNPIKVRVSNVSTSYATSLWSSSGSGVFGLPPGQSWDSEEFCSGQYPMESHIQAFNHNDSSCNPVKLPIHCK